MRVVKSACLLCLVVMLLAAAMMPRAGRAWVPPPGSSDAVKRAAALKPNLDISLYRRSYTPDETPILRLSGFNTHVATLSLYRFELPSVVSTSRSLENFGASIKNLQPDRLPRAANWNYDLGKIYADNWSEHEVKLPHVAPGVYLIVARAGVAEKRTWYAVTPIALIAKRSRQELLVYAANAHGGAPTPNLPLTITDAVGRKWSGSTDGAGLWRGSIAGAQGNLWIYGEKSGSPAFILSGAPPAPEPYTVYAYTDRPVYRPGQTVQYSATIRQRVEAAVPGGIANKVYANANAEVEVRDGTDALISRRTVTTNRFGTFDGSVKLATEPPLGRWQIVVRIGEFRSYATFEVQAYRKPEYTASVAFPASHYLGGATVPVTISARYFFGQPVAHAEVKYQISFNGRGGGDVEPNFNGQGVTDADGKLTLQIKTQRHPVDRDLSVSATITDLSRRSQSASGSALITAGAFRLSMETDKYVYHVGEAARVTVHATDYDDKPVQVGVKVTLTETRYDRDRHPFEERSTRQVTTNAKGEAVVTVTPRRPGDLSLSAVAFDAGNDKIEADGSMWVVGDEYVEYDYQTLELVADHPSYQPGATATVLVNTNLVTPSSTIRVKRDKDAPPTYPDAWALVTLEGERLYTAQVVHLTSRSNAIRVLLTEADYPSVSLHVTMVQEKHIFEQQQTLTVTRQAQKLQVSVAADSAQFTPGQTANYTVTTRDYQGRPVQAEVGLGVVDAAIYAITPDTTPDIESVFYSGQQVRTQTDFSFAAQYSGGAFQTIPKARNAPAAPGTPAIRVRRLFADTAYWNPFVDTDASGVAHVQFTVPDNLTTWRATARGLTTDTRVGSATAETVSTMPLLVRLELPRFSVEGDETVVSAIVHNYTGETKTIQTSLETAGVTLMSGAAHQAITLPARGQQRLDWRVHVVSPESARFLVTADGGTNAQDAMELTLPTQPDGLKMVEAHARVFTDTDDNFAIRVASLPPNASLTLTLTPSLGSAMFDALGYLQSYPYGCAEQTMSSFLPDIVAARAINRLHVTRKIDPHLNEWVGIGLQKLYRYQHGDGGWHWWEYDQSDPEMTAYVLSGLLEARDAGYTVDEQRILRGVGALRRYLAEERDPSRRADYLLTLAMADPKSAQESLQALLKERDKLDVYGAASLCLALARAGRNADAETVARELTARAVVHGTSVSWTAEEGGYSWREDDVDVTAHVLRALLTVHPKANLSSGAIRYLMANRTVSSDGSYWNSTKTTAEVVFALALYLEQTVELHPRFDARVLLDGSPLKTLNASDATVFDAPTTVTVTPDQLRGHQTVTVEKVGAGTLYLTDAQTYILPPGEAAPRSRGLAVHRTFEIPAEDPSHADSIASGQEIEVSVDITADSGYRYAMLEEPIPAGCEVQSTDENSGNGYQPRYDGEYGSVGYTRQEVRDDKIVFFFDSLPKGVTHVSYRLHAETPGAFRILPSIASLAYFPEVRGNSGLARTNITEAK